MSKDLSQRFQGPSPNPSPEYRGGGFRAPQRERDYPRVGLGVWSLALVTFVVGALMSYTLWRENPDRWLPAYLVGWITWTGISLGSLSLLLLHNITGGAWGDAVRPVLRGAAGALWLMPILFLPIFWHVDQLYPWADLSHVENDPILQHKSAYLNVDFFRIRVGIYFAIWLGLLAFLAWQDRRADTTNPVTVRRIARFSGQGLVVHGLTVTFAGVDWMMSLEPHWFSMIYGALVFVSFGLAAHAMAISFAALAIRPTNGANYLPVDPCHDLGKLLLAFVMLWAYMSFAQFLIIWYGNLPEEVGWYLKRFAGDWRWVALSLVILHFALPFMILLSREWKRSPVRLSLTAVLLLVMYWVNLIWMIKPAVESETAVRFAPWLEAGFTLGMGGLWLGVMAWPIARGAGIRTVASEAQHG